MRSCRSEYGCIHCAGARSELINSQTGPRHRSNGHHGSSPAVQQAGVPQFPSGGTRDDLRGLVIVLQDLNGSHTNAGGSYANAVRSPTALVIC